MEFLCKEVQGGGGSARSDCSRSEASEDGPATSHEAETGVPPSGTGDKRSGAFRPRSKER